MGEGGGGGEGVVGGGVGGSLIIVCWKLETRFIFFTINTKTINKICILVCYRPLRGNFFFVIRIFPHQIFYPLFLKKKMKGDNAYLNAVRVDFSDSDCAVY